MRYLVVSEFGTFLGLSGKCLIVKHNDQIIREIALSRLRSICIVKKGISLSSDLVEACAIRGIKIFFLDWRGQTYSALIAKNQHAVVALRKAQFASIDDANFCNTISKSLITVKIKNQRAVLLYFCKYLNKLGNHNSDLIRKSADDLSSLILKLKNITEPKDSNFRNYVLGIEGASANFYWNTLKNANLLADDFIYREGRYANSITNKALNYGYAILLSYVFSAVDNAGLEVYAGFLHTDRPGKPSLVLDLMEEYRSWVVDRNIIKLREKIANARDFDFKLKKDIADAICKTMQTKYLYNRKKVKLENILQRQIYRFSGSISKKDLYKGYVFRW